MQPAANKEKISFIDNLRVLMTVLVVLHHTFISYGAPGSWYYSDKTTNEPALIVITLFVATKVFLLGLYLTQYKMCNIFLEPGRRISIKQPLRRTLVRGFRYSATD